MTYAEIPRPRDPARGDADSRAEQADVAYRTAVLADETQVVLIDVRPKQGGSWHRLAAALPGFIGAVVILVVRLGPGAAAATITIACIAVMALLRMASRWSVRHYAATSPDALLRAEASLHQAAGIVRVEPSQICWTSRRGRPRHEVVVPSSAITGIEVVPIDSFMIQAARLTVRRHGEDDLRMTVTAPAPTVESALRSMV